MDHHSYSGCASLYVINFCSTLRLCRAIMIVPRFLLFAVFSLPICAAETPALESINAAAQAADGKRNLGDATTLYKQLLAAEPPGRSIVVVTDDQEVVRDVRAGGARVASAAALVELLERG